MCFVASERPTRQSDAGCPRPRALLVLPYEHGHEANEEGEVVELVVLPRDDDRDRIEEEERGRAGTIPLEENRGDPQVHESEQHDQREAERRHRVGAGTCEAVEPLEDEEPDRPIVVALCLGIDIPAVCADLRDLPERLEVPVRLALGGGEAQSDPRRHDEDDARSRVGRPDGGPGSLAHGTTTANPGADIRRSNWGDGRCL